ncbi:MAG: hypothetical protein GU356_07975 [Pyrobaculum sp.]|jgi:hypothetical protein|nr:hypothetical protein [Pyrobaculum sp.]
MEGEVMIRSRPLWRGGADVNYNVYLRNNKLQLQSTDTPIIRLLLAALVKTRLMLLG